MSECADCWLCHKASLGAVAPIECTCGRHHLPRKSKRIRKAPTAETPTPRLQRFVHDCLRVWWWGPRFSGIGSSYSIAAKYIESGIAEQVAAIDWQLEKIEVERLAAKLESLRLHQPTIEAVQVDGRGFAYVPVMSESVLLSRKDIAGLPLSARVGLRIIRQSKATQQDYARRLVIAREGNQLPLLRMCDMYGDASLYAASEAYADLQKLHLQHLHT